MTKGDDVIRKNFLTVFLGLLVLLLVGVVGYMLIEGWDLVDSLYMTFISFSTVGFREVGSMGQYGRMLTMFIILFGLVLLSMLSASVTSLLVRRDLLPRFEREKMKREIERLKGHTILCGAGETGKTVIEEFVGSRKPLVVIDREEEILERLRELHPAILTIVGDATKDEILQEANIEEASALITALEDDAANLFVVISARSLKSDLIIVSRAVDANTQNKMYKAGATHVISPNITEGSRMASVVLRPTVVSFLDVMMRDEEMVFRLEEIPVPVGSAFHGKRLEEVEIPRRTGIIVIAIEKETESGPRLLYNPQSSTIIQEKDKLIVLGDLERIDELCKLMLA